MREITFRRPFYDNNTNEFSFFTYWGVHIKGAEFVSPGSPNFAYAKEDEQYTGLLDKNGVEIYEGDLLCPDITYEVSERKGCSYVESAENGDLTFKKVESLPSVVRSYHDGGYEMYNQKHDRNAPFWINYRDVSEKLEVIGNIHESPELLTS